MTRAAAIIAMGAAALVGFAGCGLERPYPDQAFYVLEAAPTTEAPVSEGSAVRVPRAGVAPPFGSRAIQYRVAENRYEASYYHNWADDPGALVAATARDILAGAGARVVGPGSGASESATLELEVTRLAVNVTGRPTAEIALRATVLDADGTVLMTRQLERTEPARSAEAPDAVRAMNDALRALLGPLAGEIAGAGGVSQATGLTPAGAIPQDP